MSCCSQYRSEQSDHIERGLYLFGLGAEDTTFMTDDGPAYHIVANRRNLIHVLCTKHYDNGMIPASSGLRAKGDLFKKHMFAAKYHNFQSPDALANHFKDCFQEFSSSSSAHKFMTLLQCNQKLVCCTHAILIFTAGAKATQRGGNSNARLNIGTKKIDPDTRMVPVASRAARGADVDHHHQVARRKPAVERLCPGSLSGANQPGNPVEALWNHKLTCRCC
jgi:hypothetical protein